MGVYERIVNNTVIKAMYKLLFYFELGKGTTARFYQFIPDIIIILGGMKYLLGVDLTATFTKTFVLVALALFTLMGYFINKTGLYEVDRYVIASKDPVQREMLAAARAINGRKK